MRHYQQHALAALAVFLIYLTGCKESAPAPPPPQKEVILLHTGRILGNVFPLSLMGRDIAPLQYYQFLAGYVDAVRREAAQRGATVFLIDSGDGLQGSFASKITDCANMVEFYNALDYDVVILGNLDAPVRPEQLTGLRAQLFVPFVTAEGEPGFPGAKTHGIITKNGVSLAILANFHGDLDYSQKPDQFPSYYAGDINRVVFPFRKHNEALAELKALNPDYIVFNWFKFESPEAAPKIVTEIAEAGADLIAAHRIYSRSRIDAWTAASHNWPLPVSLNTQRANNGYILARIDFARDKDGKLLVTRQPARITMDKNSLDAIQATPDAKISALMEKFAPTLLEANLTLGTLSAPVDETGILNIYLESLSRRYPGSIAMYSTQSIRAPWPSGPLTSARIFEALPWLTPTVQVRLTPEQLAALSKNENFRTLGEPSDPQSPALITSAFFGILLKREFNLPADAMTVVSDTPEADSFTEWLGQNPDALGEHFSPANSNTQNEITLNTNHETIH
jgi:hypothetical protein